MDCRSINQRNGTTMIAIASTAITLALVFYTIGVFAERLAGTLKLGHIIFFYMGLVFDTAGTAVMSVIARGNSANLAHATTGLLAIILMIIHAAWATIAYAKKNPETLSRFHRLSIGVWLVWLVPYVCGMLMGIPALKLDSNVAFASAIATSVVAGLLIFGAEAKRLRR